MIANDKIGQAPANFDNVIDNIFEVVCGINFHKGKTIILETYDPTQLQPIRGRSFLVSPCVIPCYKIIPIKNSVRTQDYINNLLRIHSLFMNLNGSAKASHL